MEDQEFKEKCRELIFKSRLRDFPVIFEMYVRTFGLDVDLEATMAEILSIIRTSETADVAYQMVRHYLDGLE